MSVTAQIIAEGSAYSIYEVRKGKKSHLEEFFQQLPQEKRAQLIRLIEFIAENGAPRNEQKFRHEGDGIYAIKHAQVRIYCFFDSGRVILLTHGTLKKQQKADPEDLRRAKRLREAYLTAKRP